MTEIERLIQPHLLDLKPYSSARHDFTGQANVFLDANENPVETGKNRYPDPHQTAIKKQISEWRNVDLNQIFLGNGSDEAIDLLIRLFCRPGIDEILVTDPTYGMYSVCAQIHNVRVRRIPLTSTFDLDMESMITAFDNQVKLLFICHPNNPTGNVMQRDAMMELLQSLSGNCNY